jgi:two-component system chemotaxis response regulator CheB
MSTVKVLVVDDSKFTRQVFKRVFRDDDSIEVVGEGRTGLEAVELNEKLQPDVITLDIDMPEMGGLEALDRIMATRPTPVLMVSSHTKEQSELAFLALEKGAVDFVDKNAVENTLELGKLGAVLRAKVLAVANATMGPTRNLEQTQEAENLHPEPSQAPDRIVVVGASTGGPPVVQKILKSISKDSRDAFVVVQHMAKGFTASFSSRLDRLCELPVRELDKTTRIQAGEIWVAKAGKLLEFRYDSDGFPQGVVRDDAGEYMFQPSIDLAMETAATYGIRTVGVILTGMGNDGSDGIAAIERAGGQTFVQDPSEAVLTSMPSEALARLSNAKVMGQDLLALQIRDL